MLNLGYTGRGQEYATTCFPVTVLGLCPPHTAAQRQMRDRQVQGEMCHRGGPGHKAAAQPPQFLQPQRPCPQPQSTPHHSPVLYLGQTQWTKGYDFELLLRGTVDTYTSDAQVHCDHRSTPASAITSFGKGHTLNGRLSDPTLRTSIPKTGEQTEPNEAMTTTKKEETLAYMEHSL